MSMSLTAAAVSFAPPFAAFPVAHATTPAAVPVSALVKKPQASTTVSSVSLSSDDVATVPPVRDVAVFITYMTFLVITDPMDGHNQVKKEWTVKSKDGKAIDIESMMTAAVAASAAAPVVTPATPAPASALASAPATVTDSSSAAASATPLGRRADQTYGGALFLRSVVFV